MNIICVKDMSQLPAKSGVAIYGAASTGVLCHKILEGKVAVDCFLDDDITKVGSSFCGLKVVKPEDFLHGKDCPFVVLGTIYSSKVIDRLQQTEEAEKITVYDISALYEHAKYEQQKPFMTVHDDSYVWDNIDRLYDICPDAESHKIIDTMKFVYKNNYTHFDVYRSIASKEEQYFTKQVLKFLGGKSVSLIDAGAYHGEIISDIIRHRICIKNLYLVEADADNFKTMKKTVSAANDIIGEGVHLVMKGLWDSVGDIYLEGDDKLCRIVDYPTNNRIAVTTIDEIVKGNIDFVKMDIEGAEMRALKGGLETIKHDRPALAIAIYHSPEDFVRIPLFLHEQLSHYKFSMLHHMDEYCDTVLYGIPE